MIKELFGKKLSIESERLYLRPIKKSDAEDLYEIFSDSDVMRYYDLLPFKSMDEAKRQADFFMQGLKNKTMVRWGIELKESKKLVGTCGFFSFSKDDKKAEMGYELNKNFQGQGIMSEAIRLILDFIFSATDINRIEAFIEPPNLASQNLVKKIGFVKEADLREYELCRGSLIDISLWALLRADWNKRL